MTAPILSTSFDEHRTISDENFDGGCRMAWRFPNGYGASVISSRYSYGGKYGLYELAVLNSKGNLTYDTPITNDVIGHLTGEQVEGLLLRIWNLPGGDQ